jgi:2-oxo-4-hydroxy-4-carboxy-5-ureidoimidazoline decarboxylase
MVARRPFGSLPALLAAAEASWLGLASADWQEAFAHHPRIGERHAAATPTPQSEQWSATEQAGMAAADAGLRAELAELNREYERRFGYIYIVAAAGRSATELRDLARQRLQNSPETELRVAAREHLTITRQRLEKLLA